MSKDDSPDSTHKERGFALFAVLSFLLLAAAIVTPLVTNARSGALIARNVVMEVKNRVLADSLIALAGEELSRRSRQPDFELPRSVVCTFGQASVRFDIQNHAGLIDLNAASADLLRVGFLASGHSADAAGSLVQTVIVYRSVEQISAQAETVTVAGGLKHGLFESVDELNDFKTSGAQPDPAYRRIFTIRTATGTILNSALPASIETVLKTMPPESAYFVVSGSPPLFGLTLSVSVSMRGKPPFFATTEIGLGSASGFRRLSPLRVTSEVNEREAALPANPEAACSALFDQGIQSLVRTLIEGETRL